MDGPSVAIDPEAVEAVLAMVVRGDSEQQVAAGVRMLFPDAEADQLILAATDKIIETGQMPAHALTGWCVLAAKRIYIAALAEDSHEGRDQALKAIQLIHKMGR